jgi:hypothetical protein
MIFDPVFLAFHALAAMGLAWIVGHSAISLPLRTALHRRSPFLVELLECPGCFGFWTGLAVGLVQDPWWALPFALFTSATNTILLTPVIARESAREAQEKMITSMDEALDRVVNAVAGAPQEGLVPSQQALIKEIEAAQQALEKAQAEEDAKDEEDHGDGPDAGPLKDSFKDER